MILYKIDVDAIAQSLTSPFQMEHIAPVDHFAVYLYLCRGVVSQHRHLVQDELFYVHQGAMSLATEWGNLDLASGELAVVPRGVAHRSGSRDPSTVMLFQADSEPERKNGHGRLTAADQPSGLPKWSIAAESSRLSQPFMAKSVAAVDEMCLRVVLCEGATRWHAHDAHDEMLFVVDGELEVGTEMGPLTLKCSELLVVPRARMHRLTSQRRTIVLSLIHGEISPLRHMGY